METVELLAQKNLKDLITKTKEEQISQSNNEQLPELYKSCPISMLSQYLQTLREEFYDIDQIANLLDDIRFYEITNPIVERLHMNIETSMHNKALYGIKDKSHIFKSMMKDYYIIHDIECDLISNFLTLIQNHIDAAKKTENVTYLGILGTIKENIYFKYNSNIETFTMEIPISDDELYTKKRDYLENMIIRCIWELIKYTNEDLEDEKNYAKANALALYLQSALSLVPFKDHYKKLAEQFTMDTTVRGIINTAFIQEQALKKQLVKDDENECN